MDSGAFLDGVEYQLMEGNARWMADFPESIRQVRVADVDFDLVAKGSTRGRTGYFLSAMAARISLPDYTVAGLVKVAENGWDQKGLQRALQATRRVMEKYDLKWSWLLLAQEGDPDRGVVRAVQSFQEKEIGVGIVNLENNRIVARSNNLLGAKIVALIPGGRRRAISPGRPAAPGVRSPVQISRVTLLFGGFLVLLMLLSGISLRILVGVFAIPLYLFLGDVGVAALLTLIFYMRRFHLGLAFDEEGFRVIQGTDRRVEASWADYDMVSLFHMGGGRYHLTLYLKGNHSKFVDIPASAVRLDPLGFRRKAMELTGHGRGTSPSL